MKLQFQFKIVYSLVLLSIIVSGSFAQIYGTVKDGSTNQALPGANVYLANRNLGTVSDTEGRFVLSVKGLRNTDTLVVSYLGYAEYRRVIGKYQNHSTIRLQPRNLTLGEAIQIYAERMDMSRQEIPHTRYEVDAAELERYQASEIADLFKKMPSVRIEGNDLDGRHLQIRGSNAGEVNVYYDGILINELNFDNSADLSVIPTEAIHKLEVMKGASLPLMGNGAFGGVVNVISKKSVEPGLYLKAKRGDFKSRQYLTHLSLPLFNKLYINYFGQYSEMQPTIEYFQGERFSDKTENHLISTNKMNHSLSLDYYHPLGQLSAKVFAYRMLYDKPFWFNDRENLLFALTFNGRNNLNISISNLNSFDHVRRYTFKSTQDVSDYETTRLNVKISKKYEYRISSVQFLGEYFHDELTDISRQKTNSETKTYYRTDLYNNKASLAAVFSFNDTYDSLGNLSWKTYLGMRADAQASGERDFTLYTGARLKWHKNNRIFEPYLTYGKNVRYPTLLEAAYVQDITNFSATDTTFTLLKPEYNQSFELGAELTYNFVSDYLSSVKYRIALFNSTVYNKILKRPFGDYFANSQIGRNTTKGVEASLRLENLFRYFNLSSSFVKMDIENKLLYEYKPEQNYNAQLEFYTPFGLYAMLIYFVDGKSYAWYFDNKNELATDKISGTSDMDISAGFQFDWLGGKCKLYLSEYNVFDNSKYEFYYLRKRNFQLGFSVQY